MCRQIINSLLDNDNYKLTMQQVVFNQFPCAKVRYEFINRGGTKFPSGFATKVNHQVDLMSLLKMSDEEYRWLTTATRYMKPTYMDWLRGYRFDASEVKATQNDGDLRITIEGPWYRTILWEVPLLAIVSELYYMVSDLHPDAKWKERTKDKSKLLTKNGCEWADFGTRRRFSHEVQDYVVQEMSKSDGFRGTSNPYFAMRHSVTPIGTYAHEGPMAMQARYGFRNSNRAWTKAWVREFQGDLGIALPDTLTSEVFLRSFGLFESKLFDGMRQDSGDPIERGELYIAHYKKLHIEPSHKRLVPSDALVAQSLVDINDHFKRRIRVTGGIGTSLTNDVGVKPLNMVIKLTGANFGDGMRPVVKLSDVPGKHTGVPEAISHARWELFGDQA
jgi:nicotinate phosphoribosyltransferase